MNDTNVQYVFSFLQAFLVSDELLSLNLNARETSATYKICVKNLISAYNSKLNETSSCSNFVQKDSIFNNKIK